MSPLSPLSPATFLTNQLTSPLSHISDTDYCEEYPSSTNLTGITIKGLSGTTTRENPININCPADETCGITMSDITVEGTDGTEYQCANTPSDIGIDCTDGASG